MKGSYLISSIFTKNRVQKISFSFSTLFYPLLFALSYDFSIVVLI